MNQLCRSLQRYGPLLGRLLIAQLFLVAGLGKMGTFANTAALMASHNLPLPQILLVLTIALEFGGAILLIVGWKARWVAAPLFCLTLVATWVFHPFWAVEPKMFTATLNDFMKNLAIMGGLLFVIAFGAGPLSIGSDACGSEQGDKVPRKKKK